MGKYNGAVVTTAGQNLIAQAIAGGDTVTWTTAEASSYAYPSTTDFQSLTSLQDVEQTANITGASVYSQNIIQVTTRFDNTGVEEAFLINTIGIYAQIGTESPVLVAVVTADSPDQMPVEDALSPSAFVYNIQMLIQNVASVSVTVNPAGTVNVGQLGDYVEKDGGEAGKTIVSFTDSDLDSGITSFPTFLSKIISGIPLARFMRDFVAGMQYVLHVGSLQNNGTTTEAGKYALDAAYGKTLADGIASLISGLSTANGKITTNTNNITAINNALSVRWAFGGAYYSKFGTDQSFTSDLLKQPASSLADLNVTIRWEPSQGNDYYLNQVVHSGTRFQYTFDLNGGLYTCVVYWNRNTGNVTVSGKTNCYLYRISPIASIK